MAVGFQVTGLDAAIKRSEHLAATLKRDVQDELNAFAFEVEGTAKQLAPADEGRLRNAISAVPGNGNLEASIVATVGYAAFMEFGTRKFAAAYVATLPPDWQSYAATFKGQSSGNFDSFLLAIIGWVKRKGIENKAAYPIALSILRNGIRERPFLYPAVNQHKPELTNRLKNILDQ